MKGARITALVAAVVTALGIGTIAVKAGVGHGGAMAGLHGASGGPQELHRQFEAILDRLDLTLEQRSHVDRAHSIMQAQQAEHERMRGELDEILARVGDGTLDRMEMQSRIDSHLEQLRQVAYDVSGELVDFVNSLDPNQRAMLKEELTRLHQSMR